MGKKILMAALSIFLIFQSYQFLIGIEYAREASLIFLIFYGWIINMFITGIFAFTSFSFPTEKLLPISYYKIKDSRQLKKVYKYLRVDLFRKMLLATLWKSQKQRAKHFDGKKSGITNLEEKSMKAEFGHLIPFILISLVSLYLIVVGMIKLGIFTMLFNFLGNFYPVILQRHHRMRVERIRQRAARKR